MRFILLDCLVGEVKRMLSILFLLFLQLGYASQPFLQTSEVVLTARVLSVNERLQSPLWLPHYIIYRVLDRTRKRVRKIKREERKGWSAQFRDHSQQDHQRLRWPWLGWGRQPMTRSTNQTAQPALPTTRQQGYSSQRASNRFCRGAADWSQRRRDSTSSPLRCVL